MGDNLSDLSSSAIQEINECSSSNELESLRVKYLGKKGIVTAALKSLSKIDPKDRWENTPYDEAVRLNHEEIIDFLQIY